jgi:hypothetical protein
MERICKGLMSSKTIARSLWMSKSGAGLCSASAKVTIESAIGPVSPEAVVVVVAGVKAAVRRATEVVDVVVVVVVEEVEAKSTLLTVIALLGETELPVVVKSVVVVEVVEASLFVVVCAVTPPKEVKSVDPVSDAEAVREASESRDIKLAEAPPVMATPPAL